jgi:stage II sporulation protein GA (sporulation sigma-E factor processing peptidase)
MTIYIDVLVSTNIYISYFLLLGVCKITKIKPNRLRLCLGALLGGLSACTILLRPLPMVLGIILKLIYAFVITLASFHLTSIVSYIKTTGVFFAVTFVFGGMMFALETLAGVSNVSTNNFSVYLDISPVFLIFSTVVCYAALSIYSRFTERKTPGTESYEITVALSGKEVCLTGMLDTGNSLAEPFSGLPVIVVMKEKLKEFTLPAQSLRVIPFESVGGDGLLMGFKPDSIKLCRRGENKSRDISEAYIGIYSGKLLSGGVDAIINPDILIF